MFTRIFILTLSLLLVGKAWAYSKDNHEWLTQEAAKFAYLCANQDFSDDVVNALISFNRDQDELLRKSDMWHFPPPLGNDPKTSKSVEWAIASFFVMNTDFSVWV
jgi:hypothetical protein